MNATCKCGIATVDCEYHKPARVAADSATFAMGGGWGKTYKQGYAGPISNSDFDYAAFYTLSGFPKLSRIDVFVGGDCYIIFHGPHNDAVWGMFQSKCRLLGAYRVTVDWVEP